MRLLPKFTSAILFLLFVTSPAFARSRVSGWCEDGNQSVVTPATPNSTTKVQRSYPGCTVNVYQPGTTTHVSIYSNNTGTAKANPFTAATSNGQWFFYVDNSSVDVNFSGAGISAPFTRNFSTIDPQIIGGVAYADTFTGADLCAKITAAIAVLPAPGGTVDARGLTGTQACATNPFAAGRIGITTLLGNATITIAVPWILPSANRIIGAGREIGLSYDTILRASGGFEVGTFMMSFCTIGTAPCFGIQATDFELDCNGVSLCSGIENNYSQEQSWFRRMIVINAPSTSFSVDVGGLTSSAAQNSGPYEDLEGLSEAYGVTGTVCFRANLVPALRALRSITCNADGYITRPTNAILFTGTSPTHISDAHIEHFANGIVLGTSTLNNPESVVTNVSAGPDTTCAVVIGPIAGGTNQDMLISAVENSTSSQSVLCDQLNSITLNNAVGLGTYWLGRGAFGLQTIFSSRDDVPLTLDSSLLVRKNVIVPGTGASDASYCFGSGSPVPFCLKNHSGSSGDNGALIKTNNLGIMIQNGQVTEGNVGGGLSLNGNGFNTDPSVGQVGAGMSGDTGTTTARGTTAAFIQFLDGVTNFYADSGLTIGNTYTPTLRWQMLANGELTSFTGIAFASLGTPRNGTLIYCTNCTNQSNPCTASGSGAYAKRLNGAWDCR